MLVTFPSGGVWGFALLLVSTSPVALNCRTWPPATGDGTNRGEFKGLLSQPLYHAERPSGWPASEMSVMAKTVGNAAGGGPGTTLTPTVNDPVLSLFRPFVESSTPRKRRVAPAGTTTFLVTPALVFPPPMKNG